MDTPSFLDSHREIQMTSNHLPHWEQDGSSYFITFRLADSLPSLLLSGWREEREQWLKWNPPPWNLTQEDEYHRRFSSARERWLDAQYGACPLAAAYLRARVVKSIWIQQEGVTIWSGIVMPNHVHILCSISHGMPIRTVVGKWKGRSARQANLALGTAGVFWSKDYFDRLIRNAEHFRNCAGYIRGNPKKAGIDGSKFSLTESCFVSKLLSDGN